MIRGKYLREKKAKRINREIKLIIALVIVFIIYKILFESYSLYESEANSSADIDVAFYLLNDDYETKTIALDEMLPGDSQFLKFTISNYYIDENNKEIITETDMKCNLKIRTTTNLPLKYELYIDQDKNAPNLQNKLEIEERVLDNVYWDKYNTMFKRLVLANQTEELKKEGITDSLNFYYNNPLSRTYILKVKYPDECSENYKYQNIIECVEISVDSHQIISGDSN